MFNRETLSARWTRARNRIAARRAALSRATAVFTAPPEPRSIGCAVRGRQICAGRFVIAGHLVEMPTTSIWDIVPPDAGFAAELHGFGWLDDLAAVADMAAQARAQAWVWQWIARHGAGSGPGWTPDLTGRRLIRWMAHAEFLLRGQPPVARRRYHRALARQTTFLRRRWPAAGPGLPTFEALTGLIQAGVSLAGMEDVIATGRAALARECARQIDDGGGIPTRNPEELLEVFTLLTWAAQALSDAGHPVEDAHWRAVERVAPTLRTLRHADGGLARFHGGGRGLAGRLDSALATSGVKSRRSDGLAMGFARLGAGRTSVIVDAAIPPLGAASAGAHASTLAFELTSGRRPLIVNCGSGARFGAEWRRAGRATPSHSALVLDAGSSARLSHDPRHSDRLSDAPREVPVHLSKTAQGVRFEGAHDGYLRGHGLTHVRKLDLAADGRALVGEDLLLAVEDADRQRFDRMRHGRYPHGIPFDIRFHLHPEVDTVLDDGANAVSVTLRSGETWVLRTGGPAALSLQPSVYLEKTRLSPRVSEQIVLSGHVLDHATRIRWSLAKADDTPVGIRDVAETVPEPATTD
ncbi:heparinase II/III family protein [Roseovarius tibetensis]|uniref:heparinase II/III family protein n=1 Tax=Roseovarius tibetensis TaxID=2685897 RepID=UPI003D7F4823